MNLAFFLEKIKAIYISESGRLLLLIKCEHLNRLNVGICLVVLFLFQKEIGAKKCQRKKFIKQC